MNNKKNSPRLTGNSFELSRVKAHGVFTDCFKVMCYFESFNSLLLDSQREEAEHRTRQA